MSVELLKRVLDVFHEELNDGFTDYWETFGRECVYCGEMYRHSINCKIGVLLEDIKREIEKGELK